MDKIKEKLDKLRIEADGNLARAEKSETDLKDVRVQLASQETHINNLNNKVTLLTQDLERQEKRFDDVPCFSLI